MDNYLDGALSGKTDNYILPFFWMHEGNTARLADLVQEVYDSGVRALCVESRPHEKFGEEEWWIDMEIILEKAESLRMKVWVLDDKHFPTGYANGLIDKKYPERKKWHITERHMDALGPMPGAALQVPRPVIRRQANSTPPEDTIIGAVAYPRSGSGESVDFEPLNLTDKIRGDYLFWDVPPGFWRVFYLIKTRRGAEKAEYIHPIDRDSAMVQIEGVYEPHYQRLKKYFGNTLAGFFSDEPYFGNDYVDWGVPHSGFFDKRPGMRGLAQPWTDELYRMLCARYEGKVDPAFKGFEALPLLAGLWYDIGKGTPQIRYDYMDIVTCLYRDHFCRLLGEWCRARGVQYIGHIIEDMNAHARLGCSTGHFFRSLDGQDMSGIDIVLHQVMPGFGGKTVSYSSAGGWADSEFFHYVLAKLGSSMAHINGHQKNRAMCEVFGAYGWAEGVPMMKWLMDHLLVRGINRFVPHAFSPKFPDPDCPPHFGAAGRDPQFEGFSRLMEYTNRAAHLLEGAIHQASCAVLYHAEAEWMNGNDFMLMQKPAKMLYDSQIDYDIVPLDALGERALVESRRLKINQEYYACLIVPRSPLLPEKGIECLNRLSASGLPVFYVDGAPEGIRNPEIIPLASLAKTMIEKGFCDVKLESSFPLLRVGHWKRGDTHLYMLFNEDAVNPAKTIVHFPFALPGLKIDLLTDHYSALDTKDSGAVKVNLEPYRSVFFVFGPDLPSANFVEPEYKKEEKLNLLWDIELYDMGKGELDGKFKPYRKGAELHNITESAENVDFSGVMRYRAEFNLDKVRNAMALDLGIVGHTAKLKLNGKDCGMAICPPYVFDISGAVKEGINIVEIDAANTLAQRIRDHFSFFIALPPSGIFGPLRLKW